MDTGMFPSGKKNTQDASVSASLSQAVAEAERRLRTIEERFSNLERRSQVTEENMLTSDRKIKSEIRLTSSDVSDVKAQIAELTEKIKEVIRELQGFARAEDVDVIRKYLNLIEPLGFVTQNEVDRIVRHAVEEALGQQLSEQGTGKE
ncbi:hypothetical protein HYY73_03395 [Candidatus Woesearchaeota archaeon]|nr:hypothetical protein [Candidatus Woesearchaeota archaeon]